MAEIVTNIARKEIADGTIDLANSSFQIMLVSTSYLDAETDEEATDRDFIGTSSVSTDAPTTYEAPTTSGYARQTLLVAGRTFLEVDAGNRADIDGSDITFSAVSSGAGVIGAAILFHSSAGDTDSARTMIAKYETGFPVTPNGGDITLQFSTGGFLQFTT